MNARGFCLATAVLAFVHLSPLKAQGYTFKVVDYCDGYAAFPSAMNNQGTIVGAAFNGGMAYSLAFVYKAGECKTISLGTAGTSFLGITDNGDILGLYGNLQNYLYNDGALTGLPPYPGAEFTYYCCLDISKGALAGNYLTQAGGLDRYGFVYEKGKFRSLPNNGGQDAPTIAGISKKGIVVGTMNGVGEAGFTYVGGKMRLFQYPGATYTSFDGISDNDLIVGTYYFQKSGKIGILTYNLDTGVWTDLKFPYPYDAAAPVGITNSGLIAAAYSPSGGLLIATPTN
jgi:hypothetical protein